MEWIVVKTLLSLTAVVGLMFAVVFIMKRTMYGGKTGLHAVVDMKVIGSIMLQPKRSVSLLKVMNKVLIVGISEDGMETLGEIEDERSLQQIEERLMTQAEQSGWLGGKPAAFSKVSFTEALGMQIAKLKSKGA